MIEPATPFHAAALAEIHRLSFPPHEVWTEAAFATQLGLPGCFGFVAETGGFALARAIVDEAELLTLAVLPALRRRGLGIALVGAVLREAELRGAPVVFLEVSARNPGATALYAQAGFRPVGRRAGYYPDGADAVLMRRQNV